MGYVQKDLSLMPTFRVGDALEFADRKDSTSPLGNIEIYTNRIYIVEQYLKNTFGNKIDITYRGQRSIQFDVLAVPGSDLLMIHSKLNSLKPMDIFGDDFKDIPMENLAPRTKDEKRKHKEASGTTRRISWLCNDGRCNDSEKCSNTPLYIFDDHIFTKAPVPMSW